MEHREALACKAAERYFREELSPAEREAFEEHYFGCAECAREVADIAEFLAAGKIALQEHGRPPERPRGNRPRSPLRRPHALALGFAAGLALAAALAAALGRWPGLPEAGSQIFPELALNCAPSRDAGAIAVPAGCRFFGLEICTGPAQGVELYELDLRGEHGEPVFLLTGAPPPGSRSIHVLIPARPVISGWYRLTVRGTGAAESAGQRTSHRFRIERY